MKKVRKSARLIITVFGGLCCVPIAVRNSDKTMTRRVKDVTITRADGSKEEITLLCRIDTLDEVEYYKNGGILQYVLRNMMQAA